MVSELFGTLAVLDLCVLDIFGGIWLFRCLFKEKKWMVKKIVGGLRPTSLGVDALL